MTSLILNQKMIFSIGILGMSVPLVLYLKNRLWNSNGDEDDLSIDEVMFFSDESISCRAHFKNGKNGFDCPYRVCPFANLRRMTAVLQEAKESLDVCMYILTVRDLSDQILRAHKRGLKVRIITDEDMANNGGSQMHALRQNGMQVRHRHKATTLMHHKFVVIDKKILMTGSLNWTMQAICGNWDNLIITSHWPLVKPFLQEFERAWQVMK